MTWRSQELWFWVISFLGGRIFWCHTSICWLGLFYLNTMVFRRGMNSWFWYEFKVCSMGPISANIADDLLKIDDGM
jgi:hypothetical protein